MMVVVAFMPHVSGIWVRPQKRADAHQPSRLPKNDLLPLLAAVATLYLSFLTSAQAEQLSSFADNRKIWGEHTVHTGSDYPLSPFRPQTPQYQQFEELDKHDKRIALAQIAAQLIAQNLDNRLGRAILAVRQPSIGGKKGLKCNQKINMKKYYLTCKLRF